MANYEDKDGAVAAEKEVMSGTEIFGSFYGRLKEIRDYHRKFPDLYHESEVDNFIASLDDDNEIMSQFTGEEMYGRFLDLNPLHMKFINLKGTKAVTYEAYLNIFSDFSDVPKDVRTKKYKEYVEELRDYLTSFIRRTQPLQDVDKLLRECDEDFEEKVGFGPLQSHMMLSSLEMNSRGAVNIKPRFLDPNSIFLIPEAQFLDH